MGSTVGRSGTMLAPTSRRPLQMDGHEGQHHDEAGDRYKERVGVR